jgi:hypothetical protein
MPDRTPSFPSVNIGEVLLVRIWGTIALSCYFMRFWRWFEADWVCADVIHCLPRHVCNWPPSGPIHPRTVEVDHPRISLPQPIRKNIGNSQGPRGEQCGGCRNEDPDSTGSSSRKRFRANASLVIHIIDPLNAPRSMRYHNGNERALPLNRG